MEAQRLLIAESNEDLRLALARELQTFYYVRCCSTGTEALTLLRKERPELLVLGMCLPEIDGLTLLETIASESIRPMVLAMTTYHSDYLESAAYRLGVSYILLKPFSLETVVHRVLDMKQYLKALPPKRTPELIIEELLQPLGIHPQIHGYNFLRQAIILMAAEQELPQCKAVYLDTAKYCNTTFHSVESAIRRIIENHWDPDTWQTYFPGTDRHPSAKTFLAQIARRFREAIE